VGLYDAPAMLGHRIASFFTSVIAANMPPPASASDQPGLTTAFQLQTLLLARLLGTGVDLPTMEKKGRWSDGMFKHFKFECTHSSRWFCSKHMRLRRGLPACVIAVTACILDVQFVCKHSDLCWLLVATCSVPAPSPSAVLNASQGNDPHAPHHT
jgi:hypothetical protein